MASTNKTPNFDLSQFIGSDKPTYLGDYNSDMSKIDTAMATNKTNSENAVTVATGANETASNAQTIATQAQTTAQQANTLAQTAKSAADTAQASADNNTSSIQNLSDYMNITQYSNVTSATITKGSATLSNVNISLSTNSDKTLGKIYGSVNLENIAYGTTKFKISNQPIYIDSEFTIACCGLFFGLKADGSPSNYALKPVNVTITKNSSQPNNSDLEFDFTDDSTTVNGRIILLPCLYYFKNFNDSSITN